MERTNPPELLSRFAAAIETNGIQLVPADLLADLVRAGRAVDASPIAIDVLVDPTEPWVARERAFGLVATQIIGRAGRADSDHACGRSTTPSTFASGFSAPVRAEPRRKRGVSRAQV